MPNYSKNKIVLVRYPFSDLTNFKVRPAVIVNAPHLSKDLFVIALTSKTQSLMSGEFVLSKWQNAGLNVEAKVAGQFKPEHFAAFDRLQIVTVQEILDGKQMNLPLMEQVTKQAQRAKSNNQAALFGGETG